MRRLLRLCIRPQCRHKPYRTYETHESYRSYVSYASYTGYRLPAPGYRFCGAAQLTALAMILRTFLSAKTGSISWPAWK